MKIQLGCIADDFTGATDLANNLVRSGMRVVQTIGVPEAPLQAEVDAVVVALSPELRVSHKLAIERREREALKGAFANAIPVEGKVTGRNKGVIEDHFDRQFELELTLKERNKVSDLKLLSSDLPEAGTVSFTDVPIAPRILSTASLSVRPAADLPSIATM